MRIDYKIEDKFDFILFFTVLALIIIGLLAIYSSTQNVFSDKNNFEKQLFAFGIGLILFFTIYSLPTNLFKTLTIPIYIVSIFLLLVVLVIGHSAGGAKSWIVFGPLSFQPSEFAKFAVVLTLSYFLSKPNTNLDSLKDISISVVIVLLPVILIFLEPDLGSSLIFFIILLTLLFWKGISLFGLVVVISPIVSVIASLLNPYFFAGAIILVLLVLIMMRKDLFMIIPILGFNLASGFFVEVVYNILSPHQQRRIQSFVDPFADPLGSGYNSIQAQIAIGSGGIFGKGFMNGNQTQLHFIPQQWTDFIYCVIGEEFGFVGSIIVISLFITLFFRIIKISSFAKDEFLSLLVIGFLSIYFSHFFINIGMSIGLLPVIGIPLPFVSYGGSSLVVNLIMLGIIANIYRTRKNYT